jgi:hypothetical protein
MRELFEAVNVDGLSPLLLAGKLGSFHIFHRLWEDGATLVWAWGSRVCRRFPLRQIDDVSDLFDPHHPRPKGSPTALQVITDEANDDSVVDSKDLEVLRAFVDLKWKTYSRGKFVRRLVVTLLFSFVFLFVVTMRRFEVAAESARPFVPDFLAARGFGRLSVCVDGGSGSVWLCQMGVLGEVAVIVGWAWRARELSRSLLRDPRRFFHIRGATAITGRVVGSLFVLFFAAALGCEIIGAYKHARAALTIASTLSWSQLLYFFLGFELTGPTVVMSFRMIRRDLIIFSMIVGVMLLGFLQTLLSGAFVDHPESSGILLRSVMFNSFMSVIGQSDAGSSLGGGGVDTVTTVEVAISIAISVIGNVILYNVLVAMMNDTYRTIKDHSRHWWFIERTRIILELDAGSSPAERLAHEDELFLALDGQSWFTYMSITPGHHDEANAKARALAGEIKAARQAPPPREENDAVTAVVARAITTASVQRGRRRAASPKV